MLSQLLYEVKIVLWLIQNDSFVFISLVHVPRSHNHDIILVSRSQVILFFSSSNAFFTLSVVLCFSVCIAMKTYSKQFSFYIVCSILRKIPHLIYVL